MKRAFKMLLSPPMAALALLQLEVVQAKLTPASGPRPASDSVGVQRIIEVCPFEESIKAALDDMKRLCGKDMGYKVASWYGPRFHGRRTASGERYDMHAMTCAHRSLPFGTVLHLENPKNRKAVVVVVNDRGPFIKGRSLDLSRAAAERLGLIDRGYGRLKVTHLGRAAGYEKYIGEPTYAQAVRAVNGEAVDSTAEDFLPAISGTYGVPVGAVSGMVREGNMVGGPALGRDAVYAVARLSAGDLYCRVGLQSGRLCFLVKRDDKGDEAVSTHSFYVGVNGSLEEAAALKTPPVM